jgi:hypothetical protein
VSPKRSPRPAFNGSTRRPIHSGNHSRSAPASIWTATKARQDPREKAERAWHRNDRWQGQDEKRERDTDPALASQNAFQFQPLVLPGPIEEFQHELGPLGLVFLDPALGAFRTSNGINPYE